MKAAELGSVAGSKSLKGLEEAIWLCPIEDRCNTPRGALCDPGAIMCDAFEFRWVEPHVRCMPSPFSSPFMLPHPGRGQVTSDSRSAGPCFPFPTTANISGIMPCSRGNTAAGSSCHRRPDFRSKQDTGLESLPVRSLIVVQRANDRLESMTAMAWQPDDRGPLEPVPAWDRRIWLVAVPLVLVVVAAFLPVLENGFVNWDDSGNFLENPHFRGLGWRAGEMGLEYVLDRRLPAPGLVVPRGAVCHLEARPARLPPDQPRPACRQCRRPVCLDGDRARPVPGRCLPPESLGVCPGRGSGERPCSRCILCGPRPWPGPRASPICPVRCSPCWRCWPISARPGWRLTAQWGWLVGSWVLLRGGAIVQGGGGEPAGGAADPGRLSAAAAGGRPGTLVRAVGAEGVVREGPVRRSSASSFMGLAIAAKARSHTIASIQHASVSARIAQACYGIWFYLVKTVLPLEITAYYPLPERIDWFAPPFLLSHPGNARGERRPVSPAPALAGVAGGLAELPDASWRPIRASCGSATSSPRIGTATWP